MKRSLVIGFRRQALKPLRVLGKLAQSNDALVIGNGPSAQTLNWTAVVDAQDKGMAVFAINYFPLSPEFKLVQPNYLVLSDLFMKPNSNGDSRNVELRSNIQNTSIMKPIVPLSWHRVIKVQKNLSSSILHFDDSGLEGCKRNTSPLRARGYLALTVYKVIAISIFLGFRETKIIGVDNSMFQTISVDATNRLIRQPNHFFTKCGKTSDLTDFYPKVSVTISMMFNCVSIFFAVVLRGNQSQTWIRTRLSMHFQKMCPAS